MKSRSANFAINFLKLPSFSFEVLAFCLYPCMQRTRNFLFFSSWGLALLLSFFLESFFFSPSSLVPRSCNLEDQGWVFILTLSSQVLMLEYFEVTCGGNCRRGNPTIISKAPIPSSLVNIQKSQKLTWMNYYLMCFLSSRSFSKYWSEFAICLLFVG